MVPHPLLPQKDVLSFIYIQAEIINIENSQGPGSYDVNK